jgi:hypothetical protein
MRLPPTEAMDWRNRAFSSMVPVLVIACVGALIVSLSIRLFGDFKPADLLSSREFPFSMVTAIGFIGAIAQLWLEFDWRKKEAAVKMLSDWNANTGEHREAIEQVYPGLLDVSGLHCAVVMSQADAKGIYLRIISDPTKLALHTHLNELLNYCEYVAVAADTGAADKGILGDSFDDTLHRWFHALTPFMLEATSARGGRNPWTPFQRYAEKCCTTHREPGAAERCRLDLGAGA